MKLLCLLFFPWPAYAMLVAPSIIESLLNSADLEADIEIESRRSFPDALFHAQLVCVARVLKVHRIRDDGGWFPREGDRITIETHGGEKAETGVMYSGLPRPYKNQRYRASLKRHHEEIFRVTGFDSGLVPLRKSRNYSRNRTDGSDGAGTGPFLYWDQTYFPIPYFVSLPTFINLPSIVDAVDLSFQPWRNPGNVRVEFLPMGCNTSAINENDGINTVIIVTQNWAFDPAAIAITRNFYVAGTGPRAGLILDSDIMLNAVNHSFTTTGDPTKHDVQNIVTHEAGHFIGMGHEVDPKDIEATMYNSAQPGETNKRTLHADDLAGLAAGYSGVGQKFVQFPTSAGCNVESAPFSCASAHGQHRGGGHVPAFLLGVLLLAGVALPGLFEFFLRLRGH